MNQIKKKKGEKAKTKNKFQIKVNIDKINQELISIILPDGSLDIEWRETDEIIDKNQLLLQKELYSRYIKDFDSFLLYLGFCNKTVPLTVSLNFWRDFTGLFTHKLSQTPNIEKLKNKIDIILTEDDIADVLDKTPLMSGSEYINRNVLIRIWSKLNFVFKKEIKSFKGKVSDFIKTYSPDVHLVGRIYFHLVESKKEDYPFAFLATYSTKLNKEGKSKHIPLKYALTEYGKESKKLLDLLSTVQTAANESSFISEILNSGEIFHPLALSAKEAFIFLKEVPVYEKAGILCRIPNWWKARATNLQVNIGIGNNAPSFLGMDAILDFNAKLYLGDTPFTKKELKKLLSESEGLAFIKGKWIEVDKEKLQKTLQAYEQAQKMMKSDHLTLKEAMRLQLNSQKELGLPDDDATITITNGKWLQSVIGKLINTELITSVNPGRNFKAKLRPYQKKGLNWLYFLHSLKFGACLADDMGLGKTIQLLALLNVIKKEKPNKACLLVLPASLISNWVQEIKRFSPKLNFFVAHPSVYSNKNKKFYKGKINELNEDSKMLNDLDLVITTYALVQKYEWAKTYTWNYIVLDEAQAIKNPGTKQTRAVKKLNAVNRIILTGTPIENRLSDLWSLFDFLNPGLLGSANEFGKFTKKLRTNVEGYARLKKVIKPYILRRLKTDKSVISDLPDKVEMKVYSELTKKQIALYDDLVKDLKKNLEENDEGIKRKGVILSSLTKFKQICNHPDQYLGREEYLEKYSGKFLRLREICETIMEKHEKVLIFTQFREIIPALEDFLKTIFQHEGLHLDGSTPVRKRKNIIEEFQSHQYIPFMILSLKAGGVGLNLTAASHVIHFDRWWNPAVENQATDRVFRIGQKKNVIVHKFITRGTIEEKIDMMLEEKASLSEEIIQSSKETWITEMDNKKLLDLFQLSL